MAVGTVLCAVRVTQVQTPRLAGMARSAQQTRDQRDRPKMGDAVRCLAPHGRSDLSIHSPSPIHSATSECQSLASTAARAAAKRAMGTRYGEQDT